MRRFRLDPLKVDCAVAALLTAGAELEVWLGHSAEPPRVALAATAPLMAATVAVRRRYPATAGVGAGMLALLIADLWQAPSLVSYGIAWMCAMYGLAVWATPRRFAFGVASIALVSLASVAFGIAPHGAVQFTTISLVALLIVHRVVGDREQRARIAERERDLVAREAVVDERARIARELHDVIAHNVSMIVVQAGAERRMLGRPDATTHDVLQTIEQIGRSALTEMRRLVGMLRSDGDDPLTPQPGLGDLPRLVTQVREAGLPVELSIEGEPRELPVGIGLSAYRIIQEALTNALKHAGDAHATVHVRYGVDSLELEVVDDGAGSQGPARAGGHGLVGMRERVALYGGQLDTSRGANGGFAVRALLPLA